ncbi:hydantoinase/oxoprolinase family protein [Celeribacter indicus]|uniref:Hydantoinase A n=1 Tax=Celeribacter indicus TaxID=1208324 RepID=A0A0B5E3D0_9RHOB|nr:hydantoinase/oxoprolinase family protein [Celeribacter indicus]AJE47556.1 hydantoinase A [Celeribacter indicus]SDW10076.1 N-methylhydantoinase A [Celeribacter indicus]
MTSDKTLTRSAPPQGQWALGIDIGGTFTDIVLHNERDGTVHSHKELTTPGDPATGVLTGMETLFAREKVAPGDVGRIVHATTLFTNALIERKGAETGMITTQGFRDVLEIGTERKYELYDNFIRMPEPLVRRSLRIDVPERVAADGSVVQPLDEAAVIEAGRRLVEHGVDSVAIVFLHSYAYPEHECRARDLLEAEFPGLFVSISSEVVPEIREFERSSTTVANAYVKPLASRYLNELEDRIRAFGIDAGIFMMLSSGGFTHVEEARRVPVQLLESGPAAGALSAAFFGERSDHASLLAFDMGGTTAKLAMIDEGEPSIAYRFEAARERRFRPESGLPLSITTIELIEIGAGGGSIASVDGVGLLKVGPRSAGSTPGPACYGRGGTDPTVTDATLLLGYLDPETFANGTIAISPEIARDAFAPLCEATGLGVEELAWGIYDVVNENMVSAARMHIAENGKDPRRYALLATGGGGPLHGCAVAGKLGIREVICPPSAGVASASGLLVAPVRVDRSLSVATPLNELDWDAFEAEYRALEEDATAVSRATGAAPQPAIRRAADIRYVGQGFELVVDLPSGPFDAASLPVIRERFEAEYRRVFQRLPDSEIEIMNIRVSVQSPASDAAGLLAPPSGGTLPEARKGLRQVRFGSESVAAAVYTRALMGPGSEVEGPAIIEEPVSTLVVPPGARARVHRSGNLVVTLDQS